MSKGVVGAIEIVAGVVLSFTPLYFLSVPLIAAGLSTELAARAEIKAKNKYNASLRDRYAMTRSTQAARQIVLGRQRVSGPMFFSASYGPNREHLSFCVALAAHEIDAVELVYFDDQPVMLDGSGNVLGVRKQDTFSIAASTATVTIADTPKVGTVSAVARYGDVLVPLTVTSVSGVNVSVSGAHSGETGQLYVYYRPDPDPYVTDAGTFGSVTVVITTSTQNVTMPVAPDTGSVYATYQLTSGDANDATPITIGGVSGTTVTLTGATVGRTAVVYYQKTAPVTKARVRMYLGAPGQAADAGLIANFPGVWTSAHTVTGVAYLVVELDYDQDAFIGGIPNVSAVIRGAKCFDPRTGTTVWTENPALHARYMATSTLAGDFDASLVDDVSVSVAANVCDTATTYTVGDADYVRPLYRSGYTHSIDRKPYDALTDLCQAMGGDKVVANGMLRICAGSYRAPVLTLDEDWLVDDQAVGIQCGTPRANLVNTITSSIADLYQDFQEVPLPRLSPPAYTGIDGTTLAQDIQYPAVTFSGQAMYISSCVLRRMRQGLVLKVRCNMRAWRAERFDNILVTLPRFGFDAKPFEVMEDTWTADGAIELTLAETAAGIWDMDAGFSETDIAPNTTMPKPWGLPRVTNLTAVSTNATVLRQSDGTSLPRISVTWDPVTDERVLQGGCVEIRYWHMGDSSDSFQTVRAAGTDTQIYLTSIRDASYLVTARTVSVVTQSDWCQQVAVNASGRTTPPGNVTGAAYTLSNNRAHLTWVASTDTDYLTTEVRRGAAWSGGTLIGQSAGTSLDWVGPPLGSYTLWFAHLNRSGIYSATPASLTVVVDSSLSAGVPSRINTAVHNLSAHYASGLPSVQANAGVQFSATGFIARKQGNSTATYVDSTTPWSLDQPPAVGYLIEFTKISLDPGSALSGPIGSGPQTLDSTHSVFVTNTVPSGGGAGADSVATVAYTIYDSTGINTLTTGYITLEADNTP